MEYKSKARATARSFANFLIDFAAFPWPVGWAVRVFFLPILQTVLGRKFLVQSVLTDLNERSPLHRAMLLKSSSRHWLERLMAAYSPTCLNIRAEGGNHALHCAATSGNISGIEMLLDAGVDVDCHNDAGHTPLMIAANCKKAKAALVLLEHNADPAAVDSRNRNSLHYAVFAEDLDIVKTLLLAMEGSPSIAQQDTQRMTPLSLACVLKLHAIVDLLLEHYTKPMIDIQAKDGQSALSMSAVRNDCQSTASLLKSNASLLLWDVFGQTALHLAIKSTARDCVALLIQKVDDRPVSKLLGLQDDDGMSAVHTLAAQFCREGAKTDTLIVILDLLVDAGADLDQPDFSGSTPMHILASNARKEACRQAIDHVSRKHASLVNLLKEDDSGWTPLHHAWSLVQETDNTVEGAIETMEQMVPIEELGKLDRKKLRNQDNSKYLSQRGPQHRIPLSLRNDVLRSDRTLHGIAQRFTRDDLPPCRVVVLCGAGISTSAGIPDYRSSSGIYSTQRGKDAFSAFYDKPGEFWEFLREVFGPVQSGKIQPTPAHHFLAELHRRGHLQRVYTQNIDGLEAKAGVPKDKIIPCHGTIDRMYCAECGEQEADVDGLFGSTEIPWCKACKSGVVRPDVVFFGEGLPPEFETSQQVDFDECNLLIVMGTTLRVYPFASLVNSPSLLVPRLLLNREAVGPFKVSSIDGIEPANAYRDVAVLRSCDDGALSLLQELGWSAPPECPVEGAE